MQNIKQKTPTPANYRMLALIEQVVATAPKGTALGLSDVISAMFSGHFIESGGAVTPAVERIVQKFNLLVWNGIKRPVTSASIRPITNSDQKRQLTSAS